MNSFNYEELLALSNEEFASHIRNHIEFQQKFREVMHYNVKIDRHGFEEGETLEFPEDDFPAVIVDFMVGWKGQAFALWTFWFDTYSAKYNHSVINSEQIARFNAMRDGAVMLPELGIYIYPG